MNRAAVAIPEKLFFKIGEVCEITGVQAHVLRYWESEFPMLAPQKNRAGQRTYRKRDVEMALRIKELLYDDQYTIAGAKKKLASELRGASKLKVVTPDMTASQSGPQAAPTQPAQPSAQASAQPSATQEQRAAQLAGETRQSYALPAAGTAITDDQRASLRHLAGQLRDLLDILDAGETERKTPRP
ncbi:MAG TPA: MerR family transcriptional regulator [Pyrinomonadaceae bacterium]